MNKQELIEKYKSSLNKVHKVYGDYYKTEAYEEVLKDLKQLDEPQKVTIPQFVADWYEEHKDDFEIALFRCIDHIPSVYDEGDLNEFEEWIIDGETKPFQTLVNMHQFGYTVEKEKRYIVKVKGAEEGYNYLNCRISLNEYFFSGESEPLDFRVKHTRKMLEKAGFGWVFDCEGIEVKEVEE